MAICMGMMQIKPIERRSQPNSAITAQEGCPSALVPPALATQPHAYAKTAREKRTSLRSQQELSKGGLQRGVVEEHREYYVARPGQVCVDTRAGYKPENRPSQRIGQAPSS